MSTKNYLQVQGRIKSIVKELKTLSRKGVKKETSPIIASRLQRSVSEYSDQIKYSYTYSKEFNNYSMKDVFFTSIGIEYTFLKRVNCKKDENEISDNLIKTADKRQKWNKAIHRDGEDVIEFASPAHKNWNSMLAHYKKTAAHAKKAGLVCKRQDCGSGGGHIHMGIPRKWNTEFRLRFIKNFYLDINMRPYLNWIFNESIDDNNANSMFTSKSGAIFMLKLIDSNYFRTENNCADCSDYFDFNTMRDLSVKDYGLRYDSEFDTMELRIFDMVENEKMLEDYVEFANAYFRYIYYKTVNNDSWGSDHFEIDYKKEYKLKDSFYEVEIPSTIFDRFKNKKKTIERFNLFLDTLGLNKLKYQKYIKKNYEKRLRLNKDGDVQMDYDMIKKIEWPVKSKKKNNEDINKNKHDYSGLGDVAGDFTVNMGLRSVEYNNIEFSQRAPIEMRGDRAVMRKTRQTGEATRILQSNMDLPPTVDINDVVNEIRASSEITSSPLDVLEERPIQETEGFETRFTDTLIEASDGSLGIERNAEILTQTEDPIQKLKMISSVLAKQIMEQMDRTPAKGAKITVSTTW